MLHSFYCFYSIATFVNISPESWLRVRTSKIIALVLPIDSPGWGASYLLFSSNSFFKCRFSQTMVGLHQRDNKERGACLYARIHCFKKTQTKVAVLFFKTLALLGMTESKRIACGYLFHALPTSKVSSRINKGKHHLSFSHPPPYTYRVSSLEI